MACRFLRSLPNQATTETNRSVAYPSQLEPHPYIDILLHTIYPEQLIAAISPRRERGRSIYTEFFLYLFQHIRSTHTSQRPCAAPWPPPIPLSPVLLDLKFHRFQAPLNLFSSQIPLFLCYYFSSSPIHDRQRMLTPGLWWPVTQPHTKHYLSMPYGNSPCPTLASIPELTTPHYT